MPYEFADDEFFQFTPHDNNPPVWLNQNVRLLDSDNTLGRSNMLEYIAQAQQQLEDPQNYEFPGKEHDKLFRSDSRLRSYIV